MCCADSLQPCCAYSARAYLVVWVTRRAGCTRATCWIIFPAGCVPSCAYHGPRPGPACETTWAASWAGLMRYSTISSSSGTPHLMGRGPRLLVKTREEHDGMGGGALCRCPHLMGLGPARPINFTYDALPQHGDCVMAPVLFLAVRKSRRFATPGKQKSRYDNDGVGRDGLSFPSPYVPLGPK